MTPQTTPLVVWTLRALVFVGVLALLGGCTIVDADTATGKVSVWTLMTSRQDVTVERLPDGTARWTAQESRADTSAASTALNLSAALATAAGAPVAR